jgi:hypothetical protein
MTPIDQAREFSRLTQSIQKETSRIDVLTASIATKYSQIPKVLSIVQTFLAKRLEADKKEVSYSQVNSQILREIAAEQANINGLLEAQQAKIDRLRDKLADPAKRLGAQTKALTAELQSATSQSEELQKKLADVNKQYAFAKNVASPAARLADLVGEYQKLQQSFSVVHLTKARDLTFEINRGLLNANSDIGERNRLVQIGLKVGLQTAASSNALRQSQEALVDIGEDLNTQYAETLRTTVQLVDGLGLSARSAAELVVIGRATNIQYKDLANNIASIVDVTSLAADEATRYAKQLTIAAKTAAGAGGRFDQNAFTANLQSVAKIEGALKGTLAVPGEIAGLLQQFTSFREKGGLGYAVGTGGINYLSRNNQGAEQVTANIAKMASKANGIVLEAYSDIFGVSKITLEELGRLYREQGAKAFEVTPEMKQRQDFEKRFREQIVQQGETWRILSDRLTYLMASVLNPMLGVLNKVAEGVVWLAQKLGDFNLIAVPAMVFASAIAVKAIYSVTTAMYSLVKASLIASEAVIVASNSQKGSVVGNIATQEAGSLLGNLFKNLSGKFVKGAAAAEVEAVGGVVAKGALSRIFGSIATFFTGTLLRGVIGRGLGLVLGTVFTGGWGLLIGLLVTVLTQFWPNIVNFVKGKGWSTEAGVQRQPTDSLMQLLQPRIQKVLEQAQLHNSVSLQEAIADLEEEATKRGATAKEFDEIRKRVLEEADRNVSHFTGRAQTQTVTLAQSAQNMADFKDLTRTLSTLNGVLTDFVRETQRLAHEKLVRDRNSKEAEDRKQDTDFGLRMAELRGSKI